MEEFAQRFRERGYQALFLDFDPQDGLPAGREWERELYYSLKRCRAFIALCTANSTKSRWCFAEIALAKVLGCEIFPVKADSCEIDPSLHNLQVVNLMEGETAYERLFEGLRRAGLDPLASFRWDVTRSPFPGLEPFTESDAAVFFGREPEIGSVLSELRRMARGFEDTRFGVLVGGSGVGKSSLVLAGVIPRIAKEGDSPWIVVPPFRPRGRPMEELSLALDSLFSRMGDEAIDAEWRTLRSRLAVQGRPAKEDARSLAVLLRRALATCQHPETSILLVIDQLEEFLGISPMSDLRDRAEAFLAFMHDVLTDPSHPLVALATIRSSSLEQFQLLSAAVSLDYKALPLGPLSVNRFVEVILKPAALVPIELEPALAERITIDAAVDDALPMLAFTLARMYKKAGKPGARWTVSLYEQIGGIAGSIEQTVATLLLRDRDEAVLRGCLLRFFRLDESGNWQRKPVPRHDIPKEAEALVSRLVNERLLVESAGHVEIAHEALARVWPKLRGWLDADLDFQQMLQRLNLAIQDWCHNGKDDRWLLEGPRLEDVEKQLSTRQEDLTPEQRVFIEDSLRRRSRIQDAERRMELATVEAQTDAQLANRRVIAHRLGLAVRALGSEHPQLALLLAVEAARATREDGWDLIAEQTLRDSLDACPGRGLAGHREGLTAIAISNDGRWVLTGSYDKTARLWNMTLSEPWASPFVLEHPAYVSAVSIDAEFRRIATGDADGTVRIWDIEGQMSPSSARVLKGHEGKVGQLQFNADGSLLASGSEDAVVRVWRADVTEQAAFILKGHSDYESAFSIPPRDRLHLRQPHGLRRSLGRLLGISALQWSPDGYSIATGGEDGQLILWKLGRQKARRKQLFKDNDRMVSAITFATDGMLFAATQSVLGESQVLELSTKKEKVGSISFESESSHVNVLAVSSDLRWLAAGSGDTLLEKQKSNAVLAWDLRESGKSPRASQQADAVIGAGFSQDSRTLAVVSQGSIHFFDMSSRNPLEHRSDMYGHDKKISACAFAPKANLVGTAGDDGTARIMTIEPPGAVSRHSHVVLRSHSSKVWFMSFVPESHRLVTIAGDFLNDDPSPRMWPSTFEHSLAPTVLEGHTKKIECAALSLDGRWLATGSSDHTVRIWDLTKGSLPHCIVLRCNNAKLECIAFSPGARWLITSTGGYWSQPELNIWDFGGNRVDSPAVSLTGTRVLCLSGDHRILVTQSNEQTMEIWNLEGEKLTPQTIVSPEPLPDGPYALSEEGRWLAGAAKSHFVRIWNIEDFSRSDIGCRLKSSNSKALTRLTFSRGSNQLIAVPDREDGAPQVWMVDGDSWLPEPILLEGHDGWGVYDDIALTRKWLVTACRDKTARLWNLTSKDPSKGSIVLQGHSDWVMRLSISQDERRLATGDNSGEVHLWNLASDEPSAASVILQAQDVEVTAMSFSADNRWLAVGSNNGALGMFRIQLDDLIAQARLAVGRNLSHREWERYLVGQPYHETLPSLPIAPSE